MDVRYRHWLSELLSLGIYKAFGCPTLGKYRTYYISGFTPYSACVQLFDDNHQDGNAIPVEVMDAMQVIYEYNGFGPPIKPISDRQLSLFPVEH